MSTPRYQPGPIPCAGAVFDDFRLTDHLPPQAAPAVIEHDRLIMAARPGFNRKLLPMKLDETNAERTAGGYYLLDTAEEARHMYDWYQHPVGDRTASDGEPDCPAVRALEQLRQPGSRFEQDDYAAGSFDRTSWIYSIWFPYKDGPRSLPTLWPKSPPFPGL